MDAISIDVKVWKNLCDICRYDSRWSDWFSNHFIQTGAWGADIIIKRIFDGLDTMEEEIDTNTSKMISAVCKLDQVTAEKILISYFQDSNERKALVAMSIYEELEKIDAGAYLICLSLECASVMEAALDKLIRHNIVIPGLFKRITSDTQFRSTIGKGRRLSVLNQLAQDEIECLANDNNPEFRYLAIVAMGLSGNGENISWLKDQLNDQSKVQMTGDEQECEVISEAALAALLKIGSPSAKRAVEDWQQNNGKDAGMKN